MLTLTPSAVEAVDGLLHSVPDVPEEAGLRIGAAGESQLTVELVAEPAPGDQVIEDGGARVFVDAGAADMLDAAELDARAQDGQVAFSLSPRAAGDGLVS